ncbi:MAG: hypothetical protein H7Z17_15730 [Fuerstia sp.]|nr:hypothetical protein [Fuerstiella sp.]
MTLKNRTLKIIRSRHTVLWMGWLLPQILLPGPALIGLSVLVPCDLLALPGFYLPQTEKFSTVAPGDTALTDLVLIYPMAREFTAREFRAGRLPLWQSENFCGTPFVWSKYSPFELLYTAFPVPVTLAWMQLAQALCVGTGMYVYARRSLQFEFWPAAVVSWCVPWIGFLTLWQGYPLTAPVCFLPWLLCSIDRTVSRPWSHSAVAVAMLTALVLISGAPDIAGLVLLTSGLRFLWCVGTTCLIRGEFSRAVRTAGTVFFAWTAGFMLACPHLLPFVEFARSGTRMQARAEGIEERPPVGLSAARNLILPESDGSSRAGSIYVGAAGNLLESSAGGYAGLMLACWLVPLSFSNRRRRKECLFWAILAVLAAGWTLNIPGLVHLQRLPILNMLSHNRWVFATAFSLLILAAIGLEELECGVVKFRRWFVFPIVTASILALWCLSTAYSLPEPIGTQLPSLIRNGVIPQLRISDVDNIQQNFFRCYITGAAFSLAALLAWIVSLDARVNRSGVRYVAAILLVGELLLFARLQLRQASPSLYYPRIAALERISQSPPGRILGLMCLPPNLNQTHGLRDIRGYDAVDTHLIIKLIDALRDPAIESPKYAKTQWFVPQLVQDSEGRLRLPPILSMLNTRYIVMRSEPAIDWPVIFHEDDYWVIENPDAVPRAFIPKTFRHAPDDEHTLREMMLVSFDPLQTAYVHHELPETPAPTEGDVTIISETPGEILLKATMKTKGLVAISDLWDSDWKAFVDQSPAELLRTNVAIRSVLVPAGEHEVLLRYDPESLRTGSRLALTAACSLILYWTLLFLRRRQ